MTTSTRFWDASGISAELSADGIKLSVASLQSVIAGGVAFGQPNGLAPGDPVGVDHVFRLFPTRVSIDANPHRFHKDYVVSFAQSMRGLRPGAPVTLRGIRVGTVQRILMTETLADVSMTGTGQPIPVLIRIQPGRFAADDTQQGVARMSETLVRAVGNGLRATLVSGNLLTGSMLIDLTYLEDAPSAAMGEFHGYPTLPTAPGGGFAGMENRVSQLPDKLVALPLEDTVSSVNEAVVELHDALHDVRVLMASEGIQNLPSRVDTALSELDQALANFSENSGFSERLARLMSEAIVMLESVRDVAESLEQSPNALIFPTRRPPDPQPKAPTR